MKEFMTMLIFDDEFDEPTLGSDWATSPGRGSYSLTDNPGSLRYVIDAEHTSRLEGSGQNYAKALWLVRPFSGERWLLRTVVTYNMRPGPPTNNRNSHFLIRAPEDDGKVMAQVYRSVGVYDPNPGSNGLSIYAGGNTESVDFPNSPNPLPTERWYLEVERDGNHVAVRATPGGRGPPFDLACEFTFPPGTFGDRQAIEIECDGWHGSNSPPGTVDFEFISAEQPHPLRNLPVEGVDGVGKGNGKRLRSVGVKTVADLASSDVLGLYRRAKVPLNEFCVMRRKASLALGVVVDRAAFAGILQMKLNGIIAMSSEDLAKKANQPEKAVSDLKEGIATLLVSLDDAVVRKTKLEAVAVADC